MATTSPVAEQAPRETISGNPHEVAETTFAGREDRLLLLLSIFIGIISGLLVVSFRMAIEWLTVLLQGSAPAPHQPRLIVVPVLAGLVIAVLTRYVFPAVRGSGVNQTKAALYIHNGYISTRTVVGKFLLCALAIGSGFSVGPEDPSLQIGAGAASLITRRMGLSREKLRIFAPVGAAAGLAAAFNAPISAILFVIEEVIGQWTAGVLGCVVLSAVSAVVVARWFWGAEPMFRVPAIALRDPRELLAYAVLGFVGGIASLIFAKSLGFLRPLLRRQPAWSQMLQPAAAGFLVGCIGYFGLPEVMGAGYGGIDQAMHAQFTFKILLLLAAFKIIATTLSFSSGSPGGVFAPTLFVGAMLGAAIGSFEKHYFPGLATGSIGSYALVGMGVLFAAFLRAPLTSVFMILEVSGNYSIILPRHPREYDRLSHGACAAADSHLRALHSSGRALPPFNGGTARRVRVALRRRPPSSQRADSARRPVRLERQIRLLGERGRRASGRDSRAVPRWRLVCRTRVGTLRPVRRDPDPGRSCRFDAARRAPR